jgi:hypothetical protein
MLEDWTEVTVGVSLNWEDRKREAFPAYFGHSLHKCPRESWNRLSKMIRLPYLLHTRVVA